MSTSHSLEIRKNALNDLWSSKPYCFRLRKPIATRFDQLCKCNPHQTPQDLMNDLILIGLDQYQSITPMNYILPSKMPNTRFQHIALLSGPFAEFHGLKFKKHSAIDRTFPVDETEIQDNVYALDEPEA